LIVAALSLPVVAIVAAVVVVAMLLGYNLLARSKSGGTSRYGFFVERVPYADEPEDELASEQPTLTYPAREDR